MSLAKEFAPLNANKYLGKATDWLLGKPDTLWTEQIRTLTDPLEVTIPNLFGNSRSYGNTVGKSPGSLGYSFPEVPLIFIGGCGATNKNHIGTFGPFGGGHTHMCPNDPLSNHICISANMFVRPELMWHEYAHVLTKRPYETISCEGGIDKHEIKFNTKKDMQTWNEGHNPEWEKLIQQFGFQPRAYLPMGEL